MYLDLNHWVSLAKAMAGHRDGRAYTDVLRVCLREVDEAATVFPISDSIYFEIAKIRQYRQRRDLREVIERLCRYLVVTSRVVIASHEIEALLDSAVGPSPRPINTMDYLDWGVARAFGWVGGFKVVSNDAEDVTAEARSSHPAGPAAFDRLLAGAELELNRRVIEGPTADEEPSLRGLGWNPEGAFEVASRRAEQEVEQVERFNREPRWRRGRIRDVVAAREMIIEIYDSLERGLADRHTALETVFPRPDETRRAVDSMPSFDVAVTLKTAYHRNPMHPWTANDIHDIDALGSTLPYCDIVVTDKAVASLVKQEGLSERLDTTILADLSQLPDHL